MKDYKILLLRFVYFVIYSTDNRNVGTQEIQLVFSQFSIRSGVLAGHDKRYRGPP